MSKSISILSKALLGYILSTITVFASTTALTLSDTTLNYKTPIKNNINDTYPEVESKKNGCFELINIVKNHEVEDSNSPKSTIKTFESFNIGDQIFEIVFDQKILEKLHQKDYQLNIDIENKIKALQTLGQLSPEIVGFFFSQRRTGINATPFLGMNGK